MYEIKTTFHSAASATANGEVMNLAGVTSVAVQLTGTWVGTVTFEASVDGSTWVAIQGSNANTGAVASTATANGLYTFPVAGFRKFRSRLTWTSGTSITATGIGVEGPAGISLADVDLGDVIIGTVAIDQTTPGTTNAVQLTAGTASVGKLGANSGVDIGDVDVTSVVPGTGATNLGKAEDAAHTTGDVGVAALAVSAATPTATAGAAGDYQPMCVSSVDGALFTREANAAYGSAVTITRPANTTAYTAGDVLGAAAAAITFTAGAGAGQYLLTSAALEVDVTAVPSGMGNFKLHLYNVTPPSALADNAVFDIPAGDRASYLGYIDLGTPVDLGSTLYVEQNGLNKQITLASASLFGYLVTDGGFTPAGNSEVYVVTIHTVRL